MKSLKNLTVFLGLTLMLNNVCLSFSLTSELTPKGADLKNAYGAPIARNQYGPQENPWAQYVEANPDSFLPIKGEGRTKIQRTLNKNSKIIKSGDMTNIAPSANKIIKPETAKPRLNIKTAVVYPAEVHVPTFKGFKKVFHDVTAYDKQTGRIIHDKVLLNKPDMTLEKTV
jgi:hypothetical protein